ncbi:DNA-processing protein DprA [Umboniibacter marinipuniceus]|uniref:DNA protecting protein DprA n=1 Tax=Umboniibacter marinipuniceus TaxID=569599 RepID=A0A3M0AHV4_9GAMM|nr:DNA-processing protein DprA [Umboniibacter marinipuniceus]RMA82145.1 DNA protecting protein DprA [Umboniibacter marinipuniceus]
MSHLLLTKLWITSVPKIPDALRRDFFRLGYLPYVPLAFKARYIGWQQAPEKDPLYSLLTEAAEQVASKTLVALFLGEPGYPAQLTRLSDAPVALFVRGNAEALNQPQLAVVGSRRCSAHAAAVCRRWLPAVCHANIVITSGMALGVDGLAHEAALAAGGQTVAVMGSGIDYCYPPQHQALYQRIMQYGCIVSERLGKVPPRHFDFPRRNRIIAGLAASTLVVEARLRSGSLITADLAARFGREVLAVSASPLDAAALGCLELIRNGARPALSPDCLIESVLAQHQWDHQPTQQLLLALASGGVSSDELAHHTTLTMPDVIAELATLEAEGKVEHRSGLWFPTHMA